MRLDVGENLWDKDGVKAKLASLNNFLGHVKVGLFA